MKSLITFEEFQRRHFTPEEIALVEEKVKKKLALRDLKNLLRKNQFSLESDSSNVNIPSYEDAQSSVKRNSEGKVQRLRLRG
jgi:hypothetical protein